MLPRARDLTHDDCVRKLRSMEIESYRHLISVFRAKGSLSDEKRRLIKELAECMNISSERHKAEMRKVASDDVLSTISLKLTGDDHSREWYEEGRRVHPPPIRGPAPTVTTPMADYMGNVVFTLNTKDNEGEEEIEDEEERTLRTEIHEESENLMKKLFPALFGIQEEEEATHSDSSCSSSEKEVRVTRSGAQRRTNNRRNQKRRKVRKVTKDKRNRFEEVFKDSDDLREVLPSGREATSSMLEKIVLPNLCDNPNLRRIRETSLRSARGKPRLSHRSFQRRRRSNKFLLKKRVTNVSLSHSSENSEIVNSVESLPNGEVENHLEVIESGNHHYNSGEDECEPSTKNESPERSWNASESVHDGDSCEAQELFNGLNSSPQVIKYEEGYVILSDNSSDSHHASTNTNETRKVIECPKENEESCTNEEPESDAKNHSRGKEVFRFNTLCSEEDINDDLRMIHEGIQQATKEEPEDVPVREDGSVEDDKDEIEGKLRLLSTENTEDEAEETLMNGEVSDHKEETLSLPIKSETHSCMHEAPDRYTLSAIECINFHDYFVTRPARFISSVPEGSYS